MHGMYIFSVIFMGGAFTNCCRILHHTKNIALHCNFNANKHLATYVATYIKGINSYYVFQLENTLNLYLRIWSKGEENGVDCSFCTTGNSLSAACCRCLKVSYP